MIQASNRLTGVEAQKILCCYDNNTCHVQVARIENIPFEYLEKVIFPGGRVVFETFPHAWLEIYTGERCHALLAERILCDRLRCNEREYDKPA